MPVWTWAAPVYLADTDAATRATHIETFFDRFLRLPLQTLLPLANGKRAPPVPLFAICCSLLAIRLVP